MIDVGYITFKKEQYPVRLSYRAIKNIRARTGKGIEMAEGDMAMYETILYYSLVSGHKYTDTVMKLTEEQMEDVLDECFYEFVKILPQFFPNPVEEPDAKKKKSP